VLAVDAADGAGRVVTTRVYLAARYSRHPEMQEYARQLRAAGFEITSRWINGNHQVMLNGEPLGPEREALFESNHESMETQRREFAGHDWDDLLAADVVISFTEQPRTGGTRGGRHVEFGAALALQKRCIVVGWRENVFHCLPQVEFFKTWDEALADILEPVEVPS
jgi:hypothetical protein